MRESYPQPSELAFRILLPLPLHFFTSVVFSSTVVHIKTKTRNKRKVGDGMRLVLSHTTTNFEVGNTVAKSTVALKLFVCEVQLPFEIKYYEMHFVVILF